MYEYKYSIYLHSTNLSIKAQTPTYRIEPIHSTIYSIQYQYTLTEQFLNSDATASILVPSMGPCTASLCYCLLRIVHSVNGHMTEV